MTLNSNSALFKLSGLAYILKIILYFVSFLPKSPPLWLFSIPAGGRLEGNLRAVVHQLYSQDSIVPVVIYSHKLSVEEKKLKEIYPNIKLYHRDSWLGMKSMLSCSAVFITHGNSLYKQHYSLVRGYALINLWHGVPLKGIGNLGVGYSEKNRNKDIRRSTEIGLFVSSSPTDRSVMAGSILLSRDQFMITGLPRVDFLLSAENDLPDDLKDSLEWVKSVKASRKLFLYAPTCRDDLSYPLGLDTKDVALIDEYLGDAGQVLAIRPHPNESDAYDALLDGCQHIISMSGVRVPEVNLLLREVDVLITDYSSLWLEFLLMDRPIIFYTYNLKDYARERGMLHEYEAIAAGAMCSTPLELLDAIQKVEVEEYSSKRAFVRDLYFSYKDSANSQRVIERVSQYIG
ncbi:hypothetical protein A9Q99_26140 [Gammaproteobacteria bacterium 45_16_T64]|nr:hypothetical protein A9Q99_26140 [Gammaproteobacteria bacterium 45_16_T64]